MADFIVNETLKTMSKVELIKEYYLADKEGKLVHVCNLMFLPLLQGSFSSDE